MISTGMRQIFMYQNAPDAQSLGQVINHEKIPITDQGF